MIRRKAVLASTVIALLLAALIVGDSLASGTWGNRLGTITKVSGSLIDLRTINGGTKSFLVTRTTIYFTVDGGYGSLASLKKGKYVDAIGPVGPPAAPNVMTAATVILLPNNLNVSDWRNPRDYGRVTSVSKKSFVLAGRFGEKTYKVNSGTDWLSSVDSMTELKVGMRVLVAFDADTHTAVVIVAFRPK